MNSSLTSAGGTYNLANFQLSDMLQLGKDLRSLGKSNASMEEAANAVVRHLYYNLADCHGNKCCALVRCFKTHPFSTLEPALQAVVQSALPFDQPVDPNMRCLTLLATAGEIPAWNDRKKSRGHQAIPLPSVEIVERAPMVSQLIQQMGLDIATVVKPDPALLVDLNQSTFNVFHVLHALDSPYVPAQAEFVGPFGIQSVLGFGGLLPSGELFAVIMFSRVEIPRPIADLFGTLALAVKLVLLPFTKNRVFASSGVA